MGNVVIKIRMIMTPAPPFTGNTILTRIRWQVLSLILLWKGGADIVKGSIIRDWLQGTVRRGMLLYVHTARL